MNTSDPTSNSASIRDDAQLHGAVAEPADAAPPCRPQLQGSQHNFSRIRILFLGANPSDTTRLALDREVREITQRLRATPCAERFELVQEWALRVGDVQAALLRHKPQVVHFSGHGRAGAGSPASRTHTRDLSTDEQANACEEDGEILVEDDAGRAVPITASALADLFRIVGGVRCVVLNACHSASRAEALRKHVDVVLGMGRAIQDKAAIAFAWAFYQGLGFGETVDKAFELGTNQLQLAGSRDVDVPKLLVRDGLHSEHIYLPLQRITEPNTAAAADRVLAIDPPPRRGGDVRGTATKRFDLFLSHHSVDRPWAVRLAAALETRGMKIWLDQGVPLPGDPCSDTHEQAMAESRAVALIISPESLQSGFTQEEYSRALSLGRRGDDRAPLIPVLLPGAELPGFLADRNRVDFRDAYSFEQSLNELISNSGINNNKSDIKPTNRVALLDRRLAAELIVSYPPQAGSRRVDARSHRSIIYALSLFDHVLIENQFGSILTGLVSRDELLREAVLFVRGETGNDPPELSATVAEISRAWLSDPAFQLAASVYGRTKGSMHESLPDAVEYLQQMLLLARRYNAAIVPHPDRWRLYHHWFESCIKPRPADGQTRTVISLPEPTTAAAEAVSAQRAASIARIAPATADAGAPLVRLVRYEPIVFPFPAAYAKQRAPLALAAYPAFTYEFCTAGATETTR